MLKNLKVGLLQMTSIDDVDSNLKQIFKLLQSIENQNVDVTFLPENCLYMRLKEGDVIPSMSLSHHSFQKLQVWVDTQNCQLHLGSVPLMHNNKLCNATVWLRPHCEPEVSYVKVHLFDIELEGQKPIKESDVFSRGERTSVIDVKGWKVGQSICYDLRFSELYSIYAKLGVDLILVPAAFLVKTGEAHWEILLRARAIESQCYVVASAQSGLHASQNGQRNTYGHSMIVGPWGEKLVEIPSGQMIQVFELESSRTESVRRQIPMKNHRRSTNLEPKE